MAGVYIWHLRRQRAHEFVDGETLKELVRISDRNGPLRTVADRFGATGDDSGQKRTIRDN
jgi:hypothetical protein